MMNRVLGVAAAAVLLGSFTGCPPPPNPDACKGRVLGDLVISEVMIDPEGTDTGSEWIELFNTLGTDLDLKGLTLYVRDTDGSGAKTHSIRAGVIPARSYFVVGDIRSGPNPSWINYAYTDALGSMGNARGVVGVRCGMTTLAEMTYTTVAAPQRSRMLNGNSEPTNQLAAVESNYCDAPANLKYSGNNAGTPGAANPVCTSVVQPGTCVEAGGGSRAIVKPIASDLVITEMLGDPNAVADETGEWIEVLARSTFDLNGLVLKTSGGTQNTHTITSPDCLTVQAGSYALLARSAVGNGNLPTPRYVYAGLNLPNSASTISVTLEDGTVLDAATVPAPVSGRSWQLDPLKLTSTDNDDPLNFCTATASWAAGGDQGTPGAANSPCGVSVDCTSRAAGDFIITEAMLDPDGTDTGNEWFELYNTRNTQADLTGLTLYRRNVDGSGEVQHVMPSGSVAANGYYVVGDVRSGTNPSWVNYSYGTGLGSLSNSSGVIGIRCGTLVLGEQTYTRTARAGRSRMLDGTQLPPTVAWAVEANYCDTPPGTLYFGNNSGTPGAENPVCVPEATTGTCIEDGGMRPITSPNAGDLVISELMADPEAASLETTGEWFELYARAPVDLNDLTVYTTGSPGGTRLTNNACMHVEPGQHVFLARNSDPFVNGDLPPPNFTYTGPSFSNTGNHRIGLRRGDAGIDEVQFSVPSAVAGKSWQLDPAVLDNVANDTWANFCPAQTKWNPDGGGDFGSPGTANHACIAAGSCFDETLDAGRAIVAPPDGELVITEWMSDPGFTPQANGEYFEFVAKSVFDLNGVQFSLATNADAGNATVRSLAASTRCVTTTANTHYVVGRNPDAGANGGLPSFIATLPGNALTSTTFITLINPDGGPADSVVTAGGAAGVSEQVNPLFLTPADNDGNHCQTPVGTTYGTGNRGTPGLANVACP